MNQPHDDTATLGPGRGQVHAEGTFGQKTPPVMPSTPRSEQPASPMLDLGPSDFPSEMNGLRMTRQRQEIFRVLMAERSHPNANEVFLKVKDTLPNVSLATVYNCLEALVQHGLVRQVHFDREPSRYCPNLEEHGHFYDELSGRIHDVTFKPGVALADFLELPPGTVVSEVEITLRGHMPPP